MIKFVIIGWIIFGVVTFILKCIMSSLSDAEQIALHSFDLLPKRATITTWIWLILGIVNIVLTIIAVVKW